MIITLTKAENIIPIHNSNNNDLNYCEEPRNLGLLPATDWQESTPLFHRGETLLHSWSVVPQCHP